MQLPTPSSENRVRATGFRKVITVLAITSVTVHSIQSTLTLSAPVQKESVERRVSRDSGAAPSTSTIQAEGCSLLMPTREWGGVSLVTGSGEAATTEGLSRHRTDGMPSTVGEEMPNTGGHGKHSANEKYTQNQVMSFNDEHGLVANLTHATC